MVNEAIDLENPPPKVSALGLDPPPEFLQWSSSPGVAAPKALLEIDSVDPVQFGLDPFYGTQDKRQIRARRGDLAIPLEQSWSC
jgi:hypothetical protein